MFFKPQELAGPLRDKPHVTDRSTARKLEEIYIELAAKDVELACLREQVATNTKTINLLLEYLQPKTTKTTTRIEPK